MVVGEVHSTLDDPPNTSMFMRAGGVSVTKKDPNSMAQALTRAASQMGTAIATALSPPPVTQSAHGLGSSPAKAIESRSKPYKQLSELTNLKLNGIIAERLSAKHWIAECGQKWQQVLYVYTYVRHAFGMQLNFYVTSWLRIYELRETICQTSIIYIGILSVLR